MIYGDAQNLLMSKAVGKFPGKTNSYRTLPVTTIAILYKRSLLGRNHRRSLGTTSLGQGHRIFDPYKR